MQWHLFMPGSAKLPDGKPLTPFLRILAALLLLVPLGLSAQGPGVDGTAQGAEEREALRQFLERTISDSDSFEDRYAAEVWLVDMGARLEPLVPEPDARLELLRQIHAAATRSGLAPELVLAVIEVESHFDRFAVSRVGAQGLMQVMPFWKDEIGRPSDNLTNNTTNLDYGCRILQFYLEREDGALHRALAAYNGSSGSRIYSDKVWAAWLQRWRTTPLDWSR
jgi:soluble lytic murein transglycosylase-like protein